MMRFLWQKRFYDFNVRTERKRIEKTPLCSPQSSKAWIGGAPVVERMQDWLWGSFHHYLTGEEGAERSNRTGQQPDARTMEFIPPFGDATQPESPALRFAIGRATRQGSYRE